MAQPEQEGALRARSEESDYIEGTFAGQRARLSGRETIYLIITAAAMSFSGYLLLTLVDGTIDSINTWAKVVDAQIKLRSEEHNRLAELIDRHQAGMVQQHEDNNALVRTMSSLIDEQNWLITRTEEERRRLNLSMPPSLREKLRQGPQERRTP